MKANHKLAKLILTTEVFWELSNCAFLYYLLNNICDVIKQNQSEVRNIDFKIEPNKAENFFCFLLFLASFKGVLHLWALFLKTLCIFSKNKPNLDKVSYGSGQKCSTELKNHSFTSVEVIVVKLQRKMCENQYFPCFEP